jgi:hypothetical protein
MVGCEYEKKNYVAELQKFIKYEINLNLDNIFKSYLSYHDMKSLRNSLDYFERLRKNLFAMI